MTNNIKMLQKSIIQHLKNPLYHISNKLSKSLLSSAVIFVIHEDEVNIDLIRHTKQKESKTEKKTDKNPMRNFFNKVLISNLWLPVWQLAASLDKIVL